MRLLRSLSYCAAILGLLMTSAFQAKAQLGPEESGSLEPTLLKVVYNGNGTWDYFYTVDLSKESKVRSDQSSTGFSPTGSFLINYDINRYVVGSASVSNSSSVVAAYGIATGSGIGTWSATEELTSPVVKNNANNPIDPLDGSDDGSLYNLRFTYSAGAEQLGGVSPIFSFKFTSSGAPTAEGYVDFIGRDLKKNPVTTGTNLGTVAGPSAVPELSMLPIFGSLLGMGGLALRRRNRAA